MVIYVIPVTVICVMKGIIVLLFVKGAFSRHLDGVWLSKFGLILPHVDSLQSLIR